MKKMFIVPILLSLIVGINTVYASCEDVRKDAEKVTFTYDAFVENNVVNINLNVSKITKDIYIKVTNELSEEESVFEYTQTKKGEITFPAENVFINNTYKLTVYSKDTTCTEALRTIELKTPRYNTYSVVEECDGADHIELCNQFTMEEEKYDEESFIKEVKIQKGLNNDAKQDFKINKYILFILSIGIPLIIVLIYFGVQFKNSKRGKKHA